MASICAKIHRLLTANEVRRRQIRVSGIQGVLKGREDEIRAFFSRLHTTRVMDVSIMEVRWRKGGQGHLSGSCLVEFESRPDAESVMSKTIQVLSKRKVNEFWLEAKVGFLKRDSRSTRYVQCQWEMPQRSQPFIQEKSHGSDINTFIFKSISIGSLTSPRYHPGSQFVSEIEAHGSSTLTVDFVQRCLIIGTPEACLRRQNKAGDQLEDLRCRLANLLQGKIRLVIRFRDLARPGLCFDKRSWSVDVTLKQPPCVAREALLAESKDKESTLVCEELFSTTSCGISLVEEIPFMGSGPLGLCRSYRLYMDETQFKSLFSDSKIIKKLRSFRMLSSSNGGRPGPAIVPRCVKERDGTLLPLFSSQSFEVGYHLLALMSSGAATRWQICCKDFIEVLEETSESEACAILACLSGSKSQLNDLRREFVNQRLWRLEAGPDGVKKTNIVTARQPLGHQVLRVHATPTRLKILLPEEETGNRVLRHFCSESRLLDPHNQGSGLHRLRFQKSHFLRLSFGDENGDRMHINGSDCIEPFYTRISELLTKGLRINGRTFHFLAYASSQLKAWSCWMVADPNGKEGGRIASEIRQWMGDAMDKIKIPAKCAARLGQCLSSTIETAQVTTHEVKGLPDVERSGHVFSDGVGRISPALLEEVLSSVPFARCQEASAIQVRFGGSKGVLSAYGRHNEDKQSRLIELRPSMVKFESEHNTLEVCSLSSWNPAFLNRQVILMLDYHGAKRGALAQSSYRDMLMQKLNKLLDLLSEMCEGPEQASRILPSTGCCGANSGAFDTIVRLLSVSKTVHPTKFDPLMSSCIKAMARNQVSDLQSKARIFVKEGASLMGVLDEFDLLEEGTIFVQIKLPGDHVSKIISGSVVVAKHPVAHRGDVRIVSAVSSQHLDLNDPGGLLALHYTNVVVFSQRGARSLPNMLSGSDLDGDLYQVLWDQDLLWEGGENSEPLDYSAPKPAALDQVTVGDIVDHFISYVKNDNLGSISTWLLAHADKEGVDSETCRVLAEMHSKAVDFPKSGIPAEFRHDLVPEEYPHWLERRDKKSYQSDRVLGLIYDRVSVHPLNMKLGKVDSDYLSCELDSLKTRAKDFLPLLASGWEGWEKEALAASRALTDEIYQMMNRWHISDVGELLTGCLSQLSGRTNNRRERSERREQFQQELNGMMGRARARFVTSLLVTNTDIAVDGMSHRRMEEELEALMPLKCCSTARLQAASAYLATAWSICMRERDIVESGSGEHPAGVLFREGGAVEKEEEELEEEEEEEEGDEAEEEDQTFFDKGKALRDARVHLCLLWVVPRELEEIS